MKVEKGAGVLEQEGWWWLMRAMRARVSVCVRVLSQSRRRWVSGKGGWGAGMRWDVG